MLARAGLGSVSSLTEGGLARVNSPLTLLIFAFIIKLAETRVFIDTNVWFAQLTDYNLNMKLSNSLKKTKKRGGFIISLELILISSIVVIGSITGLVAVRNAVVTELGDVASAIGETNQSYSYTGTFLPAKDGTLVSLSAGSRFNDRQDEGGEIEVLLAPTPEAPAP